MSGLPHKIGDFKKEDLLDFLFANPEQPHELALQIVKDVEINPEGEAAKFFAQFEARMRSALDVDWARLLEPDGEEHGSVQ